MHEQFAWKVASDDGKNVVVDVTHPADGRHDTLKIHFIDPDKLSVEGKEAMTFRRVR
jgi:hypothetical protein